MIDQDSIAQDVFQRLQAAKGLRGNWESHWEEIARRVWPSYAGSFITKNGLRSQGEKRTDDMVDSTAAGALVRFAAAMESMLTPRNSRWQYLIPSDKGLMKHRAVRSWFEDATNVLFDYRYAARANFASQKHEDYLSLGSFGTGCLYTDALQSMGERGLRYRAIHLAEVYFLENHQGIIDTALRYFDLTARQAIQKFGVEKMPDKIKDVAKDPKRQDDKFWFIHCVKPRSEEEGYDPGRLDVRGMPWASYYVSEEGKQTVSEGGFGTFPYSISRYIQAPGELYGRSPAMLALPAIKVLNEEKKTVLKQGHRVVDPVLLAHDDGVLDNFSLRNGAINYGGVSADGKPLVHALPSGNIAIGKDLMDDERATINDFFLVTLFQILVDSPQMTATEVLERSREKGALLSPTMGRQQSEALGPMIEREIDVLAEQGLLPPMPDILREAQGQYKVEYNSPLSRSQKAEEASGLMRVLETLTAAMNVTQDPEPLDWINWDAAVPALMDIHAMPTRWQSTLEEVMAKRQGRAQQMQQQQMVDAAPAAASVAKTMSTGAAKG